MKKQSLAMALIFSVLMMLAVPSTQAQYADEISAKIPFSFLVGNKTFPAGEYSVTRLNPESATAALAIRSADGHMSKVVLITPVQAARTQERARLVFTRYEDQYFLSQIWTPADNTGFELRKSRGERTLLARMPAGERAPQRTVIALDTRHR
jgi:hypothetical protein